MTERDLWYGESIVNRALRFALLPLSGLYCLGWEGYVGLYRTGLKKAKHPHSPIVCVGSRKSGGSGKTPITVALTQHLLDSGFAVAIGCSGYGSPRAEGASVAPAGPLNASEWGDEPALLRSIFPDVPLIVGRARVLAATLAAQHFFNHVLVMDDGFQHLPLKKDLQLSVEDENPKNGYCFPSGPYREPNSGRKRANRIIKLDSAKRKMQVPNGATDGYALCAIASPERFFSGLVNLGLTLRATLALGDHAPLSEGALVPADWDKSLPIFITAKDWVKIQLRDDHTDYDFRVVTEQVELDPTLLDWLTNALHGIINQKA